MVNRGSSEKMEINFKMDKRGIFFSVLAISLLSLFILSYGVYSVVQERESISKRISSMNNFVFLVEEDLPRQLYISGYRIIFLFEKEITESGDYINDLNSSFEDCFFNGSLNDVEQELMEGVTFDGIVDSLNQKGSKVNVNLSLFNPLIRIYQSDPWNVRLDFTCDLFIYDRGGLALWNRSYSHSVYIPIENFEDPLYVVETGGLVVNEINKTIYSGFVSGEDVFNLTGHVVNSYYVASDLGPSFLDRLQGRFSANPNGIESLVYLPELSSQGVSVKDKSCVDYIYFSENSPSSCNINGMSSWFKLDSAHLSKYEVTCA